MKIHKEGYSTLRNEIIILLLINFFIFFIFNQASEYILIFSLIIFVLSIYFFRIPKREFQKDNKSVYSPCDGKVVVIEETLESEYFKDNRIQVSIFMSPLNIHNNLFQFLEKSYMKNIIQENICLLGTQNHLLIMKEIQLL